MFSFRFFFESSEYDRANAIALGSTDTATQASKSVYNKSVSGSIKTKNRNAAKRHADAEEDHRTAEKLATTEEQKKFHQDAQSKHFRLSQDHSNNSIR